MRDKSFSISTFLPLINLSGKGFFILLVSVSIFMNQRVGILLIFPIDALSRLSMNQILESRFDPSSEILTGSISLTARAKCLTLVGPLFVYQAVY